MLSHLMHAAFIVSFMVVAVEGIGDITVGHLLEHEGSGAHASECCIWPTQGGIHNDRDDTYML